MEKVDSIENITPQVIGTGAVTIYTNATKNALVRQLILYNDTGGDVVIQLWNYLSGGSANQASKILEKTLKSKQTYEVPFRIQVGANGALVGQTNTASSISVSGMVAEISAIS